MRALGWIASLALLGACSTTHPQPPAQAAKPAIDAVEVHPIFSTWFLTTEHYEGQLGELGDALGSDCFVAELVEENGRTWLRTHSGDGTRNEDWFGWHSEVLAPIDGEVVRVNDNPSTNQPGSFEPGIASFVILRRGDGTHVLVAHLRETTVQAGDRVRAGQPIGRVGNNGNSRHPHIHLGAWRDGRPLQLRFDLRAMAALRQRTADAR
jgi:Peptidase family M23